MVTPSSLHDAIVVGAGLSGLVAARRLARGGASVLVLEARERVGGRTLSVRLGRGTADLGGMWMSPTQHRLAALARDLGVDTSPQHREGRAILVRAPRRRATWLSRLPVLHALELGYRVREIERASRRLGARGAAERIQEWDALSVAAWLDARVRTERARDMLALLMELHLGAALEDVSFLYLLEMLAATSGLTGSAELAGERRFTGGAQTLCLRIAAELGARVRLGAAVTSIEQDHAAAAVRAGPACHRARHVILALAPALMHRIEVRPALPAARRRLHEQVRMTPVIKCALAYEEPFWRQAGLSGEAYSSAGVVRAVVDHSCASGAQPALLTFSVGEAARGLSGLDAGERRAAIVAALVNIFGDAAARPVDCVDMNWPADPFSGGCVAILGPGQVTACRADSRAPAGRIHFAGAETAERWPGYLDGAIEAGERAADEVLASLAGHGP